MSEYIGYPSETYLKPKSREISFAHNLFISNSAVLYAEFQSDKTTETGVMDEWDFVKFEFEMSFGRISYIAQHPWNSFRKQFSTL